MDKFKLAEFLTVLIAKSEEINVKSVVYDENDASVSLEMKVQGKTKRFFFEVKEIG